MLFLLFILLAAAIGFAAAASDNISKARAAMKRISTLRLRLIWALYLD